MNDSYKIIISISHHRISFEYYLKGGDDALVPMPPAIWPAPLAFYCSPTGIIIGEDAARAAQSGVANAFNNYFELLPLSDVFYEIGGERKPIGKMLLDASETLFRDFFSKILLNRKGDLNDNRLNMPLTIVCEADIKSNERVYINNTFKDSGYDKVIVENYNTFIDKYIKEILSKEYSCNHVLVVWSEGTDLCLSLFDVNGNSHPLTKIFPGLGIDPRLNYVMDKIWSIVSGRNPWLLRDDENDTIKKVALDFLNSSSPLVNDEILLSDGNKYSFSLWRNNIDFIQHNESLTLKKAVDDFLLGNSISDKSSVLLLLRGIAAGNSYFESNLRTGFSSVIRSDKELRNRTMNLIVTQSYASSNSSVHNEPMPRPSDIKPSGRDRRLFKEMEMTILTHISNSNFSLARQSAEQFLTDMHKKDIHAFDSQVQIIISKIPDFPKPDKTASSPHKFPSPSDVRQPEGIDKRNFRIIKAEAKSAFDSGDSNKAISILNKFKSELEAKHIVAFNDEISALLDNYNTKTIHHNQHTSSQTDNKRSADNHKANQILPSPRDNRDFRILLKGVESKLAQKDFKAARDLLNEFSASMHKKQIHAFDDDIKTLFDKTKIQKK